MCVSWNTCIILEACTGGATQFYFSVGAQMHMATSDMCVEMLRERAHERRANIYSAGLQVHCAGFFRPCLKLSLFLRFLQMPVLKGSAREAPNVILQMLSGQEILPGMDFT